MYSGVVQTVMPPESRGLSNHIAIMKALKLPQMFPKSMEDYKVNYCSYYTAQLVGGYGQTIGFYCTYSYWAGDSTNLLTLSRNSGYTLIKFCQTRREIISLYQLLASYSVSHTLQKSFRMITYMLRYDNT